jgi:hypothetical protein
MKKAVAPVGAQIEVVENLIGILTKDLILIIMNALNEVVLGGVDLWLDQSNWNVERRSLKVRNLNKRYILFLGLTLESKVFRHCGFAIAFVNFS